MCFSTTRRAIEPDMIIEEGVEVCGSAAYSETEKWLDRVGSSSWTGKNIGALGFVTF